MLQICVPHIIIIVIIFLTFNFQHRIRAFSLFCVRVEWPTLVRKSVCLKTELKSAVMLFKHLKWNKMSNICCVCSLMLH